MLRDCRLEFSDPVSDLGGFVQGLRFVWSCVRVEQGF